MSSGTQKQTPKDWAGDAQNASTDGEFKRDTNYIGDRILASVSYTHLTLPTIYSV